LRAAQIAPRDLAWQVFNSAFRVSNDLGRCPDEE